jgi:imidazolonepropionase-like amidohydrolase
MNKMQKRFLFFVLGIFLIAYPAVGSEQEIIVIKADRILTISQGELSPGTILISKGKITEIGEALAAIPEHAKVIDVTHTGSWVTPGLIEAHTTLGARSRYGGSSSDETSNPNTAQLLIIDGINPFEKSIKYTRMAGITAAMISPGRQNVIGGQPAVLKLTGNTVNDMTLLSPAGIKISLGEGPKNTYGKKDRLPTTRMGSAFVLRKALIDAQEYNQTRKIFLEKQKKDKNASPPKRDLQLEPLAKLLNRESTAFIECYRADDIMTALRIIDEFTLKAVLVGCTEGYRIAEEIAKRNIPVVCSPFGIGPRRMETQDIRIDNSAILAKAGVKVVIKSDEALGMGSLRELPLHAALAVKGGLDKEAALRAITLSAAEVLGVSDRIGSLEAGKDADLVIFNGDPLHYLTRVDYVIIDGKLVFERIPDDQH